MKMKTSKYDELKIKYEALLEENKFLKGKIREFESNSDMYSTKLLFLISIALFLIASIAAGFSPAMEFLVVTRVFQGVGSGGVFALVYVVLSDVSMPEQRAKTLSFASAVWGIASVIGPTMGGFFSSTFCWACSLFMVSLFISRNFERKQQEEILIF